WWCSMIVSPSFPPNHGVSAMFIVINLRPCYGANDPHSSLRTNSFQEGENDTGKPPSLSIQEAHMVHSLFIYARLGSPLKGNHHLKLQMFLSVFKVQSISPTPIASVYTESN